MASTPHTSRTGLELWHEIESGQLVEVLSALREGQTLFRWVESGLDESLPSTQFGTRFVSGLPDQEELVPVTPAPDEPETHHALLTDCLEYLQGRWTHDLEAAALAERIQLALSPETEAAPAGESG